MAQAGQIVDDRTDDAGWISLAMVLKTYLTNQDLVEITCAYVVPKHVIVFIQRESTLVWNTWGKASQPWSNLATQPKSWLGPEGGSDYKTHGVLLPGCTPGRHLMCSGTDNTPCVDVRTCQLDYDVVQHSLTAKWDYDVGLDLHELLSPLRPHWDHFLWGSIERAVGPIGKDKLYLCLLAPQRWDSNLRMITYQPSRERFVHIGPLLDDSSPFVYAAPRWTLAMGDQYKAPQLYSVGCHTWMPNTHRRGAIPTSNAVWKVFLDVETGLPLSRTLTRLPDVPETMLYGSAVLFHQKRLYCFGGLVSPGVVSDRVWMLNEGEENVQWQLLAPMDYPRMFGKVFVVDDHHIVVCGGTSECSYEPAIALVAVRVYNILTNNWTWNPISHTRVIWNVGTTMQTCSIRPVLAC